jgi:hypothetical protein
MDLAPYLEAVNADLEAVAGSDEATVSVAERLARALEPSLQLRLLDALGQAAQEASEQLPGGRLDVRLAGRDVALTYVADEVADDVQLEDERGTARLTLRMPEALKSRVEEQAGREGVSTNAWLVAAVKRGLDRRNQPRRAGKRITGLARS